jgi:hypothetical protein
LADTLVYNWPVWPQPYIVDWRNPPSSLHSRTRQSSSSTDRDKCGKTTLALQVGKRRRYRYYTFDDAATLAAARADITGFVSRLEKHAILDEVQHVPELFAALKPIVDANRNAVRFILTGSSNVLLVPRLSSSALAQPFLAPSSAMHRHSGIAEASVRSWRSA